MAAALLPCLLLPQPVRAAQAPQAVTVTVSFDREYYSPGETATVQIHATAVDNEVSLAGLEFQLSTAEELELETVTMAIGAEDSDTGVSNASAGTGRGVYCQSASTSLLLDTNGVLVAETTYRVTGQAGDSLQLGLARWTLLQTDGTELSAGVQSGQAQISVPPLTLCVDSPVCKAGDIITVSLYFSGEEDSIPLYALEDTITFDPRLFSLLSDSVTTSIATGTAMGMKTDDVYDRVRFIRFGTEPTTIRANVPLVTFRLKVLNSGSICHDNAVRTDAVGTMLPTNLQDVNVSLYDLAHQPPLAWITGSANPVLRNHPDDPITAPLWLVSYGPGGRMQGCRLLSRQTLDGGTQVTVSLDATALPDGENSAEIKIMPSLGMA